jgi:hypothetical protein
MTDVAREQTVLMALTVRCIAQTVARLWLPEINNVLHEHYVFACLPVLLLVMNENRLFTPLQT